MSTESHIGYVTAISSDSIAIEIADDVRVDGDGKTLTRQQIYERAKDAGQLQVGSYLKIRHGNNRFVLANILGLSSKMNEREAERKEDWESAIQCQPIGSLEPDGAFSRRASRLPIPRELVYPVDADTIRKMYLKNDQFSFNLGRLSANDEISVYLDGDKFFSKHVAVVGSTGSGKSCTVTKILHEAVGITRDAANRHAQEKENSHVVVFDLHAEYANAFALDKEHDFALSKLSAENLKLPYWLMNSEELEAMFIESNEQNSHNQVSQFKRAVIENKKRYNLDLIDEITYDTPVYFSISEVCNYIGNMNAEVVSKLPHEMNYPKLSCGEILDGSDGKTREQRYFEKVHDFIPTSTAKADKASNGPFNGEFHRFLNRLETRLADKRLGFLLSPKDECGNEYSTGDFADMVRQYIGYLEKSNVTVVDLSGIPFEVLSICVSLVSRIIFDFCFHYTKIRHKTGKVSNVPVMLVCEEAHNYVPQLDNALYRPSRKSIERIAKEGRKYGLSLMVVSQRPSEVSETIFAQCNNFIALRLTNTNDQRYVSRLLPDNLRPVTDILPNLGDGECIAIGDAIPLPSVVQMELPNPQPQSQSVEFHKQWKKNWIDPSFEDVMSRWKDR